MEKITAYRCDKCHYVTYNEYDRHAAECPADTKNRTCMTCVVGQDLVTLRPKDSGVTVAYCPRRTEMFTYPHERYCRGHEAYPKDKEA